MTSKTKTEQDPRQDPSDAAFNEQGYGVTVRRECES